MTAGGADLNIVHKPSPTTALVEQLHKREENKAGKQYSILKNKHKV